MPRPVKLPIRKAARETANYLEPQLLDAIRVVENMVRAEKEEITDGLGTGLDNRLIHVTEHYVNAKLATQTLKAIALHGLHDMSVDERGLVGLLNIDTGKWHIDPHERKTMEPVKDFVATYGDELAAAAIKKAGTGLSVEGAKQAEARIKGEIHDFEFRFGKDRPRLD